MSSDELACKMACHDLMTSLAWALDHGENAEAADLFADDGVIVQPDRSDSGPNARGLLMKRSSEIVTHHILTNASVRLIDGTTAEGRAYVMVYRAPAKPDALPRALPQTPQGVGHWLMQFRKTKEGWRISRMETLPRLAPA